MGEDNGMKIIALNAENFKRLKAVRIEPDGDVVVVSGPNGAGKTSVLDAIWQAIGGGTAGKGTPQPIREGQKRAEVSVDLGDLRVTRVWTPSGSSLEVVDRDGNKKRSPQALLDEMAGHLTFDPLRFVNASAKDQRDMLLSVVDLPFDPDEMARRRQEIFDERTGVNRWVKQLEARADEYGRPPVGTPDEPVDLSDVAQRLADAKKALADRASAEARRDEHEERLNDIDAQIAQHEKRIAELREQEAHVRHLWQEAQEQLDAPETVDVAGLEAELAEGQQVNRAVERANAYRERVDEAESAAAQAADLTAQLDALDREKAEALGTVKMPVPGLGFDEDGVTFKGVPFSQASAAEKLRVSMAVAMAGNPKIRVARVVDGSLLDSDGMEVIAEMAAEHDMQVWVERVSDGDGAGIRIEDGEVV